MNLIVESWTEFERGWGRRHDGWSAYLNMDEREAYLEYEYSGRPKFAPDEYSQNDGDLIIRDIQDPEIIAAVKKNGYYRTYAREIN